MWVTAQILHEKEIYKFEGHRPVVGKGMKWPRCKYCGLLYLNNTFTKWCVKMGCRNELHVGYKQQLKRTGH